MKLPRFSLVTACLVPSITILAIGCGGSGSTETPPPVEGVKPAPDAPFGGLGNPYNEQSKKPAAKN